MPRRSPRAWSKRCRILRGDRGPQQGMAPVPSHAVKGDARAAYQMARGPCGGVRLSRYPGEHQAGRRKIAQAFPQGKIDRSLPMLTRRGIVAGAAAAAVFAGGIANSRRAAAFESWPRISPADAGFAPDLEARLDKLITSGRAWKQHGVVIARKGALVLERTIPARTKTGVDRSAGSTSVRRRCTICAR